MKLSEEQQEFWKQLTSDVAEYTHDKILVDIMNGLILNPSVLSQPGDFRRVEAAIEKQFNVQRVSMYRDPARTDYMITVTFHDGYSAHMNLGDEHIQ